MSNQELLIRCRIEELPFVARFILSSLKRDRLIIAATYPTYTPDFITDLDKQILDLDSIINPIQYTSYITLLTQKIIEANTVIQNHLPSSKRYVDKAGKNLVTAPQSFYLSKLSKSVNTGDRESTATTLKDTLDTINITENLAALKAEGYTDALDTLLKNNRKIIADNIVARKAKIDERSLVVNSNYVKMNALWNVITEINKDAKSIFGKTDKSKADDYKISSLIALIRKDQLKTQVSGQVNKPDNKPAKNATVILTAADDSRSYKIKATAAGTFDRTGIKANTYIATALAPGFFNSDPQPLEVQSNNPVTATLTLNEATSST